MGQCLIHVALIQCPRRTASITEVERPRTIELEARPHERTAHHLNGPRSRRQRHRQRLSVNAREVERQLIGESRVRAARQEEGSGTHYETTWPHLHHIEMVACGTAQ